MSALKDSDFALIDAAVETELSYWSPAMRAKVDVASFRAGLIFGMGTSINALRVAAKYGPARCSGFDAPEPEKPAAAEGGAS